LRHSLLATRATQTSYFEKRSDQKKNTTEGRKWREETDKEKERLGEKRESSLLLLLSYKEPVVSNTTPIDVIVNATERIRNEN
jgi:hypothetical protein